MAQLVSVPGRLDWTVWHDQEEQAVLTWTAGALDGTGPWTASITVDGEDPIAVTVDVAGDVMTLTLPAGATSGLTHRLGVLTVTDDDRDRIAGTVRITDQPGPSTVEATVTIDEQTVTVELVGDPALSAELDSHEADLDAHGLVLHRWGPDTWDDLDILVRTDDPGAVWTRTVEDGRGVVTSGPLKSFSVTQAERTDDVATVTVGSGHGLVVGETVTVDVDDDSFDITSDPLTAVGAETVSYDNVGSDVGPSSVSGTLTAGAGNFRTVSLHPLTEWADCEFTSLIWPPSQWTGNNSQMGHAHRVREISPGVWEAINIWTSVVFGGDYRTLHVAATRFDGEVSLQSATENDTGSGSGDSVFIDRRAAVVAHQRFDFGGPINVYRVDLTFRLADHLETGDLVTIDEMADATFNMTEEPVANVADYRTLQLNDPVTSTDEPWTVDFSGRVVPAGVDSQKRWTPYFLSTRVVGGDSSRVPVEIKRWRLGDAEPSWGDERVRRIDVVPNGNVPSMPVGPGRHGILDAHVHSSTSQRWGDLRFRKIN